MNPMTHRWSTSNNGPIATLDPADPCLPEHLVRAYNTVPKGYLPYRRDTDCRPDANGMFITHIPRNADDAHAYIASMQFPYTRKRVVMQRIISIPPPSNRVIYSFLAVMSVTAMLALSTEPNTLPFTIGVGGVIVCMTTLVTFLALAVTAVSIESHIDKHYDTYRPIAPTRLMREIHDRSIKVARVIPGLANKAWNVYVYDVDHYDEYAQLIADVVENPAAYGSKTYAVQREILDTFWRTSLLRQKAVQRDIDAHKGRIKQQRQNDQIQAQTRDAVHDEMRADTLTATVLDKLKADEAAARIIYGDSDDA